MGFKDFTVDETDPSNLAEGKIIKIDGKRYKVAKKVGHKVAVTRYYWFDALFDRIKR